MTHFARSLRDLFVAQRRDWASLGVGIYIGPHGLDAHRVQLEDGAVVIVPAAAGAVTFRAGDQVLLGTRAGDQQRVVLGRPPAGFGGQSAFVAESLATSSSALRLELVVPAEVAVEAVDAAVTLIGRDLMSATAVAAVVLDEDTGLIEVDPRVTVALGDQVVPPPAEATSGQVAREAVVLLDAGVAAGEVLAVRVSDAERASVLPEALAVVEPTAVWEVAALSGTDIRLYSVADDGAATLLWTATMPLSATQSEAGRDSPAIVGITSLGVVCAEWDRPHVVSLGYSVLQYALVAESTATVLAVQADMRGSWPAIEGDSIVWFEVESDPVGFETPAPITTALRSSTDLTGSTLHSSGTVGSAPEEDRTDPSWCGLVSTAPVAFTAWEHFGSGRREVRGDDVAIIGSDDLSSPSGDQAPSIRLGTSAYGVTVGRQLVERVVSGGGAVTESLTGYVLAVGEIGGGIAPASATEVDVLEATTGRIDTVDVTTGGVSSTRTLSGVTGTPWAIRRL